MALARPIHSLPGDGRGGIEAAAGRAPIISKHRPSSNLSTFSDNAGLGFRSRITKAAVRLWCRTPFIPSQAASALYVGLATHPSPGMRSRGGTETCFPHRTACTSFSVLPQPQALFHFLSCEGRS